MFGEIIDDTVNRNNNKINFSKMSVTSTKNKWRHSCALQKRFYYYDHIY